MTDQVYVMSYYDYDGDYIVGAYKDIQSAEMVMAEINAVGVNQYRIEVKSSASYEAIEADMLKLAKNLWVGVQKMRNDGQSCDEINRWLESVPE